MYQVPDPVLSTCYVCISLFNLQEPRIKYYHQLHFTDEDTETAFPRSHHHCVFQLQTLTLNHSFSYLPVGQILHSSYSPSSLQSRGKTSMRDAGWSSQKLRTLENENKTFFTYQKLTLHHQDHPQGSSSQPLPLLSQIKKNLGQQFRQYRLETGSFL